MTFKGQAFPFKGMTEETWEAGAIGLRAYKCRNLIKKPWASL